MYWTWMHIHLHIDMIHEAYDSAFVYIGVYLCLRKSMQEYMC